MRKILWTPGTLLFALFLACVPLSHALADTAYNTELVVNGGAESGTVGTIPGWLDETYAGRWSSSGTYSDWAPAAEGSRYFFLYNPSMDLLSGDMSQWISLSGTEGSGLFQSISAGNVSMQFSAALYQKISTDNEVKAVVQQYSALDTLLATSNLVSTSAGNGAFSNYNVSTQLNPDTRKFKVICSATLTLGGYAEYDKISLKLVDASTGSAPVFGSDFPASGTTDSGVAYTHGFTITDADAGDIDILSFSAYSTNINLVPAANVSVTGTGTSRTLTITPISGLSGEADVTVTASDGVKSASATIHLVVSKVITLASNLVENGNATSGFASWEGSTVNIYATGNGFKMVSPGVLMYQDLDVSKFSGLIDGGMQEFTLSASFPGSYGMVTAQPYSDIACTTTLGSAFMVNTATQTRTAALPAGTMGVRIAFSNTSSGYNDVYIRNISFILLNNYPKMTAIAAQATKIVALTVPVHVYYTTASATLSATSSDQTIVTNGGITTSGTGFDRSLTFTPLKEGTVTITATVNDGTSTASRSFTVTVHDPATITSVDTPATKFYAAGNHLDFTIHFSRNIQGGSGTTLPLTIDGADTDAAYLSATANSITYRYTLASGDFGEVAIGSAINDPSATIQDTTGSAAELDFTSGALGITAIPMPEIASDATLDEATYGTQVTFTLSLSCADTLAGSVQFQADSVNIGSPVALSGNQASYQTAATTLQAGTPDITGIYVPSGTSYRFSSLSSGALPMTILQKSVSVSGVTATNRTYDGSTTVTLSGGSLSGVFVGDTVIGNYPASGTVASANKGTRDVLYSVSLGGADAANYTITAKAAVSVVISAKPVSFTATVSDKTYDSTTNGTVSGVVFDGLVSGESLSSGVDYTAAAAFDSAGVGDNVPVTVTVTLLSTTMASNYTLSAATADTQADIWQKPIDITGVTAVNRAYNGSTAVALTGGTLAGVETADASNVGFTLGDGSVTSANAGSGKLVTTNIVLTGDAAGQYTLVQPGSVTVTVSKAPLTLDSAVATDKGYDGDAVADVTDVAVSGAIPGETLVFNTDYTATGAFNNADVGEDKPVTVTVTLAGTALAANYAIPTNTIGTTASITSSGLTISGVTAVNRSYDGTTAVTLSGGTLVGVEPADAANVGFSLNAGTIASADRGDGKAVTTSITLTGSKAGNYTLTQPAGITVDIARPTLTITGAAVDDKPYDANTDATVTGVTFSGLAVGETLTINTDYTASGVFDTAGKGTGIPVTVMAVLLDTALTDNYTISGTYDTTADIGALSLTGTVTADVTNMTGDPILIDEGDQMTISTSGVTVPGTLTYDCQWYRNGVLVAGATGASLTVDSLANDPIGTYYTVIITGTGNYRDTLESDRVTVSSEALGGSVSITGDTGRGDVLTLDVSVLTPVSATYDIQWQREGADIAGAVLSTYTIVKDDEDKTLNVKVTGNGYFAGSLSADIAVPPSPYVPDDAIVVVSDLAAVDLTAGPSILSEDQMALLLAENADKPVVFYGDRYSITYPTGTMLAWEGTLDLGIQYNTGEGHATIVSETGSDFILTLDFLHSGSLPGTLQINIYIGIEYAGQTMRYLYYNPETGELELVALVVVDANGSITVTQDRCSTYGVARLRQPQTGDSRRPAVYALLIALSMLALFLLLKKAARQG